MRTRLVLAFFLAVLLGCNGSGRPEGELPQLHPARGKVTRSGQRAAGGFVQFRSNSPDAGGNNLLVTSAVGADGSFELSTTHALSQRKGLGAPAGTYLITYIPPGESQDATPVTLSDDVTISSGSNELTIKLDGP